MTSPTTLTPAQINALESACAPYLNGFGTSYGYVPSLAAGIVFVLLFGLSLLGHVVQAVRTRQSIFILCAIGATTEIIGWAGRVWSAKCPYNGNAFLIQITTLIIAPTFFAATAYVVLGSLINHHPTLSRVRPRTYITIFVCADVASLVIQAVGGALASIASGQTDGNTKPGTNIMVAGIAFQLVSMTLFVVFLAEFAGRALRQGLLGRGPMLSLGGVLLSVALIFVRSIYRTVELAQGWSGYLITHEGFFIGLDAACMVIAVGVYNIPWLFPVVFDGAREHSSGREIEQDIRRKEGQEGYDEIPLQTTA